MFRLDQKGVSLPLVLAILGLVIANTYYFMDVEKNTKEQNIKRGSEIDDNTEKIRLATFLSDVNVCSATEAGSFAFGGRTLTEINGAGKSISLKKANAGFLEVAVATGPPLDPKFKPLYSRDSLRFLSYQIAETSPTPPPLVPLERRYTLSVTYSIMNRSGQSVPTGKTKVIRLPMYIIFTGGTSAGTISRCYTEANEQLNTVTTAVEQSCQGNTAYLSTTDLIECQHNQPDKICATSEALIGVQLTNPAPPDADNNTQIYVCRHPSNLGTVGPGSGTNCTPTPIRELLGDLQNGDKFLCQGTDPGCLDGEMLVMGPAQIPRCVKYCPADNLLQEITSAGTSVCIPRPDACPSGEYTKSITAGGKVVCEKYTLLNKSCSAGKVAQNIDPTADPDLSGDIVLGCQNLTIAKECPAPSSTTFVQSLAATALSCNTY